MAAVAGALAIALHAAETPLGWWVSRGAVVTTATQNDNAAATEGQVKQFTEQAVNEMNDNLPGYGAGNTLTTMVNNWVTQYQTLGYSGTNPMPSDFQVVNVGQLKYIGSMVWNQLQTAGYAGLPSWLAVNPAVDSNAANLGQLKTVFNFDLTYSSTGSSLPDWWLDHYYGGLTLNGTAIDPNALVDWSPQGNNEVTNFQAYRRGLNPIDFYNGQTPTLAYISGGGQVATSGSFVSLPLIVNVSDGNGNPLNGAPVTFTVTSGGGMVHASSASSPATSVTVLADSGGQAEIFFKLPNIVNTTCSISASAGPPGNPATVAFAESSDGGNGGWYPSPFIPSNVTGVVNGDGSLTINWQNNDEQSPIYIYQLQTSGTWIVTGTLPAGTISYTASASVVAEGALEIGNNDTPGGSTGNTGNGDGNNPPPGNGNPGIAPLLANNPVPMAHFVAVDISGPIGFGSSRDTKLVIDDSNNVAFNVENWDGNYTYWDSIYVWQNGVLNLNQTVGIMDYVYFYDNRIQYIDPAGDVYVLGSGTAGAYGWPRGTYLRKAGSNAGTDGPYDWITDPSPPFQAGESDVSCIAASGAYAGGGSWLISGSIGSFGTFISLAGNSVIFSPDQVFWGAPSQNLVNNFFNISQINDSGQAIGSESIPTPKPPHDRDYPEAALNWVSTFWDGQHFHDLPGTPYCLNDQGQVLGVDKNGNAYLWQNGAETLIANLAPAYASQLAAINPELISNVDPTNNNCTHIIFTAGTPSNPYACISYELTYYPPNTNGTAPGDTLFTIDSSTSYYSINASGVIASSGVNNNVVLLVPEDIIQVDAFIPQTWVDEPWFVNLLPPASYIDNGNSRKNPLDASLTSGSSIFIQNSPEFKVRETINVCAFPNYDSDGSQEVATKKTTVGETREYKKSVLVNGEIPASTTPLASDTATPNLDTATVSHPSGTSVKATLEMELSNPLVPFSSQAPIHYSTTITIDRSNPSAPTCTVTGTNCRFPAYEIYINGQQVYHFDPVPQGFAPIDLTHYDRTYNTPNIPLSK